jgi:hypothetical protein
LFLWKKKRRRGRRRRRSWRKTKRKEGGREHSELTQEVQRKKKRSEKRIMGWFWTLLLRGNGLAGYVIIQRQTVVRTVRRRKSLKGKENNS